MESLDYGQLLREELNLRRKKNPAYSARAMARDLELSPAFLSQIFSGRRLLAEDRAQLIMTKLTWPQWKKKVFVKLVRYKLISDDSLKESTLKEVRSFLLRANSRAAKAKFNQLKLEEFNVVSSWEHSAIYELTELKGFKSDPEWIAKKLGISPIAAKAAIARLIKVNLLSEEQGILKKAKGNCRIGATPSIAIRRYHNQQLDKAKLALESQSIETRDFSGTTLAIDVRKIARAKALIRRFNMDLAELLATGEKTAVYHLAVQFYQIDGQIAGRIDGV